ncbi:MAG TPA: aminotransferase [Beijerinckiaceae bacterium]|nr:aminotransferase [Beijerinckiaceae bacterium]
MDASVTPRPAINPLVADTGTPPIPEAQAWMARYGGAFGPAINMSQAVPGHPPHPDFMARLVEAAGSVDAARYGSITGDADLRETYAAHLSALYGGMIAPTDIAITAGCNMGFVVTLMLLAKSGDNILLPSPWYFNHEMTAKMLGVEARALPCEPAVGFVPDPDEAERLIDARTKAIVLVTPNNPIGAIYPDRVIQAFADLCRRRGLWLVIDETYRDFLPPSLDRAHRLFERGAWRDHAIQLYSFSKAYCIPGYRLGAVVADARVIGELAKILDCIQICAPRIGQRAVTWGVDALAEWREANRLEMHRRAEVFRHALGQSPEWLVDSVGAYFAYVRHPFEKRSGEEVAEALAVERGVLALPGSYFGAAQNTHLRMAFGNLEADRIESLGERLRGFRV